MPGNSTGCGPCATRHGPGSAPRRDRHPWTNFKEVVWLVVLCPMLLFIDGEDLSGAMGEVPCRGHIGEQYEAARLFLHTTDACGMRSNSRLQSITCGFDWARLVRARPAPAIHGPFLHRDVHQMVGSVHGAELRCRGVRIRAAEVLLLLYGPNGGLHRAIRGLDVPCQPLLPPFVLRAGADHHGAIGPPVERDLALRDFIRRRRTMRGRLRMGEDADGLPGVVRHGLGDEPPALVIGGG